MSAFRQIITFFPRGISRSCPIKHFDCPWKTYDIFFVDESRLHFATYATAGPLPCSAWHISEKVRGHVVETRGARLVRGVLLSCVYKLLRPYCPSLKSINRWSAPVSQARESFVQFRSQFFCARFFRLNTSRWVKKSCGDSSDLSWMWNSFKFVFSLNNYSHVTQLSVKNIFTARMQLSEFHVGLVGFFLLVHLRESPE